MCARVEVVSDEELMARKLKGNRKRNIVTVKESTMNRRKDTAREIESDLRKIDIFKSVILDDYNPTMRDLVYYIMLPGKKVNYFKGRTSRTGFKPGINLRKVPHRIKKVMDDHEEEIHRDRGYKLIEKPEPVYDKYGNYLAHDRKYYSIEIRQP